jgi:hypothetical protein
MSNGIVRRSWFARVAANGWLAPLGLGLLAGCSVDTLQPESRPAVANNCNANSECGGNGVCTSGVCYSRTGAIDEVLLEIVPEATSPLGTVSFLSMQNGLERGSRNRVIPLSGPITYPVQVLVNGETLDEACPYVRTGKPSVAARVQFVRTGSVGGISVAGLSNRFSLTVDTEPNTTGGFGKNVALVAGSYDIYAQPITYPNCQIAPKLWRGVQVGRDGQVVAWEPPTTLELPTPLTLNGRVERRGGELADWQVDIIDPTDEKVISTSAKLGATTGASPVTNFKLTFQPLEQAPAHFGSNSQRGGPEPLIRLRPPKQAESKAPVLYFDLKAAAVTGEANLIVSDLPTSMQLVTVSGQVRGLGSSEGVRSTVKFFNSSFLMNFGLPAAFGPAVTTDGAGRYTAELFPGTYRIVVIPEGAADDGKVVPGASPTRDWALTEQQETIRSDASQELDISVAPTRKIEGRATAGRDDVPAQGATLEAAPLRASSSGIWSALTSPPISPAPASVPVNDTTGAFTLVLDPGRYDFSLKPSAASNFAWWILPDIRVIPSNMPGHVGTVNPRLLYPVPLEGTITVAEQNKPAQPLRNATVQAYAVTPDRNAVVPVGIARTDDAGHYYLALPPGFGSL